MSTQTATAAKITYRKTGKGEWVAYGPASEIIAGTTVTVTKASGETKTETIESVGRPFTAQGQQMVYGYLGKSAGRPARKPCIAKSCTKGCRDIREHMDRSASRSSSRSMCDACGERRAVTTARDLSGFTGDVCGQCKREEGSLSFA